MVSSSADRLLLDTSTAVALVTRAHESHDVVLRRVRGARLGLAGHAAFETYSVLTRQPPPFRLTPTTAHRVIEHNFPVGHALSADAAAALVDELARLDIAGGAVYDALVGAAAREAGAILISRDRRAAETYRALGASFELI